MKLNNSTLPTIDQKQSDGFKSMMDKKKREERSTYKKKTCKVCGLYQRLRAEDLEKISSKKGDMPNISYRIKARIVHEKYDGLKKLGSVQTEPVDMIYCPLCGNKLWNDNFASGARHINKRS